MARGWRGIARRSCAAPCEAAGPPGPGPGSLDAGAACTCTRVTCRAISALSLFSQPRRIQVLINPIELVRVRAVSMQAHAPPKLDDLHGGPMVAVVDLEAIHPRFGDSRRLTITHARDRRTALCQCALLGLGPRNIAVLERAIVILVSQVSAQAKHKRIINRQSIDRRIMQLQPPSTDYSSSGLVLTLKRFQCLGTDRSEQLLIHARPARCDVAYPHRPLFLKTGSQFGERLGHCVASQRRQ